VAPTFCSRWGQLFVHQEEKAAATNQKLYEKVMLLHFIRVSEADKEQMEELAVWHPLFPTNMIMEMQVRIIHGKVDTLNQRPKPTWLCKSVPPHGLPKPYASSPPSNPSWVFFFFSLKVYVILFECRLNFLILVINSREE
jgi:hypothetical protein